MGKLQERIRREVIEFEKRYGRYKYSPKARKELEEIRQRWASK